MLLQDLSWGIKSISALCLYGGNSELDQKEKRKNSEPLDRERHDHSGFTEKGGRLLIRGISSQNSPYMRAIILASAADRDRSTKSFSKPAAFFCAERSVST